MHMTYKASGVYMCSESFNKAANADSLLMLPSPHRPHFHPRSPHPWQRREKWRQTVFLLPGEILWDGPESCDPVPHRTHLPGVYTARSVFVLGCKHNEKKTCINMKNRLGSPAEATPTAFECLRARDEYLANADVLESTCVFNLPVYNASLCLWGCPLSSDLVIFWPLLPGSPKTLEAFSVQRREKPTGSF